jgi:hypothetical protein
MGWTRRLYSCTQHLSGLEACFALCREGKPLGAQARIGEGCSFHSFRTNNYKFHFFESPSGIKVSRLQTASCGMVSSSTYSNQYVSPLN